MRWQSCGFSRGTVLGFPTGKRSKHHAAIGQNRARAFTVLLLGTKGNWLLFPPLTFLLRTLRVACLRRLVQLLPSRHRAIGAVYALVLLPASFAFVGSLMRCHQAYSC